MSAIATGTKTAQVGIIGLGVMGENLALNIEEHGNAVAVWNLEIERVESFLRRHPEHQFIGARSVQEFCRSLERPRRILLMVRAGEAVDNVLQKITPYLAPGDIVIDGGDSYFKDTIRREAGARERMVKYFGMGVSGGQEGARRGPALMAGGDQRAFQQIEPILQTIAAKTDSGPCVSYVGPDGAGHFVKMVHNGIEYGDMQLIAEAYEILNRALGLKAQELADTFAEWNRGPLESFLIEVTADIFQVADPDTGKPLVSVILDKAGQKGPGKWTAQTALELGVPVPTIAAAIEARVMSNLKDERVIASRLLKSSATRTYEGDKRELIHAVHDALYAGKICCYAQGMALIRAASLEWQWEVPLRELARTWKGGCIIRARFLNSIMHAYEAHPDLPNLLLDGEFMSALRRSEAGWRKVVAAAAEMGIPVPAFGASLAYYDAYRSEHLPHNLTQAQRDFFGAHKYQRADRPSAGFVHTDWAKLLPKSTRTTGAK